MEATTEKFDEKKALQLIESTIYAAKNKFNENGFIFRFWGWAVIIGQLLSYTWVALELYQYIGWTWCIIGTSGGFINFLYFRKREKKIKVNTFVDTALGYTWGSVGLGGAILYIYFIITNQMMINPLVLMVIGIGTFASGGILKFKPLIYGGIIFFN